MNHINYPAHPLTVTINPRQIETNHPNHARSLQDVAITVMAILNDSTGTLMSCAHSNHNCRIGVIIGKTFRAKVPRRAATSNEPHFLGGGQFPCAKLPPLNKVATDWVRVAAAENSKFFELFPLSQTSIL